MLWVFGDGDVMLWVWIYGCACAVVCVLRQFLRKIVCLCCSLCACATDFKKCKYFLLLIRGFGDKYLIDFVSS